jgi:hypothetical protein
MTFFVAAVLLKENRERANCDQQDKLLVVLECLNAAMCVLF